MFDVILAMTKQGGIGKNGYLPWKCKEELTLFKQKTMGKNVIMGRRTIESIPELKGRNIIALSSQNCQEKYKQVTKTYSCIKEAIKEDNCIIAGGAEIYSEVFKKYKKFISKVHISIMNDSYECDTFININLPEWTVIEKQNFEQFTHYVLSTEESEEKKYLQLLKKVYNEGYIKIGRNGQTKSLFGETIKFDLTNGFPLLTTKKMFFRGIVEELLFFIRGETDSTVLEDKKINIWKGNTNRDFLDSIGKHKRRKGVMGPMYGYQWRNYNAPYDEEKACPKCVGYDQLCEVIDKIKNEPGSRRILLTDFNPIQANDGVLFPCHSIIIQFYVNNGFLDMFCFNRSSDLFHGLPFNIASSALFQTMIAQITGLTARKFVLSLGDSHIYQSHYDVVKEQLNRIPYKFPSLKINKDINSIKDIEELEYIDIKIENYSYYPTLKAKMVS